MRILLDSLARIISSLSASAAYSFGETLGFALGSVIRYRRRDASDALTHAFPDWSSAKKKVVLRQMYRHFGLNIVEMLRLEWEEREAVKQRMEWCGREYLDRALNQKHGVLVLSAHTGNWELGITVLPALGYPLNVVVKTIRNVAVRERVTRIRRSFGLKEIPARGGYRMCLRALRNNEVIGFVLDQNMTRAEGVFVEFFGRPACTTPGLAHLAAVSGAPVLPVFLERLPDGRHRYNCFPPLVPPSGRHPDALKEATQRYTRTIEKFVREHPDQWIWIHRRWKTRPLPTSETPTLPAHA